MWSTRSPGSSALSPGTERPGRLGQGRTRFRGRHPSAPGNALRPALPALPGSGRFAWLSRPLRTQRRCDLPCLHACLCSFRTRPAPTRPTLPLLWQATAVAARARQPSTVRTYTGCRFTSRARWHDCRTMGYKSRQQNRDRPAGPFGPGRDLWLYGSSVAAITMRSRGARRRGIGMILVHRGSRHPTVPTDPFG